MLKFWTEELICNNYLMLIIITQLKAQLMNADPVYIPFVESMKRQNDHKTLWTFHNCLFQINTKLILLIEFLEQYYLWCFIPKVKCVVLLVC